MLSITECGQSVRPQAAYAKRMAAGLLRLAQIKGSVLGAGMIAPAAEGRDRSSRRASSHNMLSALGLLGVHIIC